MCLSSQQLNEGGLPEYRVRWEGYHASDDQWVQLDALQGCKQLVVQFEKRLERVGVTYGEEPLHARATKST